MPAYHYQQGDRPLDGFTIQHALGRGGFGEVYFAVSDAGREVALKSVQNYEDIELRGIGHCMNLKSPYMVLIFDVKQGDDGTPWVIMEYVSGSSLRDILDGAPDGLDPQQAVFFTRELAKGIDYLHDAGIVHRDLKPHNVFFEDGRVKIGDYSLSKVITTSHASGHTMTVGSVHYMAPEISMGRYDKTVDLYALGVMLYEMLTGKPPFVGESVGEVLMKHLSGELDVSGLSEPFSSVVRKAMDRDPTNRFQSAREMVDALTVGESDPLEDSIPASLSLVGSQSPSKSPRVSGAVESLDQNELADTVGPKDSISDTAESRHATRRSAVTASADNPAEASTHVGSLARFALSFLSAIALATLAFFLSGGVWAGSGVLAFAILVLGMWMLSLLIAMILLLAPIRKTGIVGAIQSRAWLLGLGAIGLMPLSWMNDQSPLFHLFVPCFLGAVASTTLLDWRGFTAFHRRTRILIGHTLIAGSISGVVAASYQQGINFVIFAIASTTCAAITVQLVSTWYDADGSPERPMQDTPSQQPHESADSADDSLQFSNSNQPPTAERVAW